MYSISRHTYTPGKESLRALSCVTCKHQRSRSHTVGRGHVPALRGDLTGAVDCGGERLAKLIPGFCPTTMLFFPFVRPYLAAAAVSALLVACTGATVAADVQFPDYDCVRGSAGKDGRGQVLDWADWMRRLTDVVGLGRETRAPAASGGLVDNSADVLMALTAPNEDVRLQAAEECPVGLLMADLLLMLVCYQHQGGGADHCYAFHEHEARQALRSLGLRVLMGTRWPVYDTLSSMNRLLGEIAGAGDPALNCWDIESPILEWGAFQQLFVDDAEWYQAAVDVAYGPELEKSWRDAIDECPLGFATANLIKAMLCAHTESICFRAHAYLIEELVGQSELHMVARSAWRIFELQAHVAAAVRRHGFHLDFSPAELVSGAVPEQLLASNDNHSHSMDDLLQALPRLQPSCAGRESAASDVHVQMSCGEGSVVRTVYVTMAHGPRFSPYIGPFVKRARAIGVGDALLVFCLDDAAWAECEKAGGVCVRGTPSILNKFTLPLILLAWGFDVMWLDMDVFLFKAPTMSIARGVLAGDFELLVSGSFAVDCVCSGIIFYRSSARTRTWLATLLSWMYEHPYEHDQKAFSAFLRAGERVAFDHELPMGPEQTPRWNFLDPETQYVSARHVDVAGWTGDADDIVAFHLLHGDSDDAVASRQFAARHGLGVGYTPLLDLFFNQTETPELYTTPVLPHRFSAELRDALWKSRWPDPRPAFPGRCNETIPMRY